MPGYFIPTTQMRDEIEIKRSRFIATLIPVADRAQADAALNALRHEFSDATHNCYAYIAGAPGSTGDIACSDDGEVAGTAGRPLLNLLQHSGLGEVLLVVTRYYGGTLLGSGGLVRAYSDAAKHVLDAVPRQLKRRRRRLNLTFDFAFESEIRRVLNGFQAEIDAPGYADRISMCVQVDEMQISELQQQLNNVTRGQVLIRPIDNV